jgi:hypothetical protein
LDRVRNAELPDGVVARGAIVDWPTLLFWDTAGGMWLVDRDEKVRPIEGLAGTRVFGAVATETRGETLVATEGGRLARLDGGEVQAVACPARLGGVSFAPLAGGIVALYRDDPSAQKVGVRLISFDQPACSSTEVGAEVYSEVAPYVKTDREGDVVISFSDAGRPPLVLTLGPGHSRDQTLQTLMKWKGDPSLSRGRREKWVAMPILPLDRGFLRVVADLRSATRRLEVYTEELEFSHSTEVVVPLGFSAVDHDSSIVVGAVGSTPGFITAFRWTWDDPNPNDSGSK